MYTPMVIGSHFSTLSPSLPVCLSLYLCLCLYLSLCLCLSVSSCVSVSVSFCVNLEMSFHSSCTLTLLVHLEFSRTSLFPRTALQRPSALLLVNCSFLSQCLKNPSTGNLNTL